MVFYGNDRVYNSSLRPPSQVARDSMSCAITRGSVPSDMVAFRSQHSSAEPGFIQQRFAITQYPGTVEKLTPREGVTPGWHEEFTNPISQCKRSHILQESGPPTLQHFMNEAPHIDLLLLRQMHAVAVCQWQQENTEVFYIVRASINLDGPHKKADLAMIERAFSLGDLRDGKGFLEFATGFKAEGSGKAQSEYLRDLDTKLSSSATLTQVQVHCETLLATCTWGKFAAMIYQSQRRFTTTCLNIFLWSQRLARLYACADGWRRK